MNILSRLLAVAAALAAFASATPAEADFVIGVAPHTSARVILEMYQPLRLFLEKALGTPVEIVTAPDFDTLARRALKQNYDMVITTGQQARLLQLDAAYIPLLTYKAEFKAVTVVAAKAPLRSAADLKNTNVIGLSPTSQVTLWGRHWLDDNGLDKVPLKFVSASDSVAHLVISGEASAGFMSLANFQKLQPEEKQQLRIFAESKPMAGRIYMLNSRHAADKSRLDGALWDFAATPEAQRYFEMNKLGGYRKVRAKELRLMDGYASEVRKFLESGSK